MIMNHDTPAPATVPGVEAEITALIERHVPGWTFAWDRAVRRAGSAQPRHRRITLSRKIFSQDSVTFADLRQTLLHEIGHALKPTHHHDRVWADAVRSIGGTPSTTHSLHTVTDDAPWVGTCPSGHQVKRMRRPRHLLSSCPRCSRSFDLRFQLAWTHQGTPVVVS